MLEIRLLGDFQVHAYDDALIGMESYRAGQLLALLALPAGQRVSREAVQARLWPESDPRRAQCSLRFLLHQIRQALGPEARAALEADRRWIWLEPARVSVDVASFEALTAEGTLQALAEAAALYRGDLLQGVENLTPDYEAWLVPERERLRETARAVFSQLFALRLWRGDILAAKKVAQRLLELDPYCEWTHAALMRLHISQGEPGAAADYYQRLHLRLEKDLGVVPGAAVEELARSLGHRTPKGRSQRFDAAWVLGRDEDGVLASKPLVAVLPFRDVSGDGRFCVLSSAMVEDIIADLARFRRMSVLAAGTSFALSSLKEPKHWLRRYGARYRVDGSVELSGNQIVVGVELVDNTTGRLLWAKRFRGDLEGLPAFREETARAIISAIPVEVDQAELERVRHTEVRNLTAYDLYLHGRDQQRRAAYDSHAQAFKAYSDALDRDPDFAAAHSNIGLLFFYLGGCTPDKANFARAVWHARRAIELDPRDPQGHWTLAMLLQVRREFDAASHNLERAVTVSPGCSETLAYTALEQAYAGGAARGVRQATEAIRLNPYYPPVFSELLGKSCFVARRYEEALFWLRQSPDRVITNRAWLAAAAAHAGHAEEARRHARAARTTLDRDIGAQTLEAHGGPIAWLRVPARFRDRADLDHYERGLALAGLEG